MIARCLVAVAVAFAFACGGSTVAVDCKSVQDDPHNCGACGHDCLGGTCSAGVCQSQSAFTSVTDVPSALAVDATYAYFMTRKLDAQTLDAPLTLYRCDKRSCATTVTPMWSGDSGLGVGLATDGANVYFANWTSVLSCPTSGCGAQPTVIAANQSAPAGIALAKGRIYWADYAGTDGRVMSCPVAGCTAPQAIVTAQTNTWGVATDDANVYWTNDVTQSAYSGVYSCPLDGCAGAPVTIATNLVNPSRIVSDGANVYWTDAFQTDMAAYFCPVTGCAGAPSVLSPSLTVSTGVAVDGQWVYAAGSDGAASPSLVRCSKSGCGTGATVLASNQSSVEAIAADDVAVYWTTWDSVTGGSVAILAK